VSNKYQNIRQLIELWEAFENKTGNDDFTKFGKWLAQTNVHVQESGGQETDIYETKQHLVFLLSRLSRLNEFYCKKFFEGLPINTLLEFSFLSSINKNNSFNKSDIIHMHMVEYSTGIDVLNRLIRLELVSEHKDGYDKRKKRIKMTSDGKRLLMEALIRIKRVQDLFFADISENELGKVLPVLDKMNRQHSKISMKQGETSYMDIFNTLT